MRNSNNPFDIFVKQAVSTEDNDLSVTVNAQHEGAEEPTDEDGIPLDTTDTPEAAELDSMDEGEDVEKAVAAAETVNDAAETLEQIYITLQNMQYSGEQFTPATACMFRIAVDTAVAKIPNASYESMRTSAGEAMPSTEDFTYSPMASLDVATEGVKEWAKNASTSAMNAVRAAIERLKAFLTSVFTKVGQMKRRVKSVQEKVDSDAYETKTDKIEIKKRYELDDESIAALNQLMTKLLNHIDFQITVDLSDVKNVFGGLTVENGEVQENRNDKSLNEKIEMAPLQKSECKTILSKLEELCNNIDKMKKHETAMKQLTKDTKSAIEKEAILKGISTVKTVVSHAVRCVNGVTSIIDSSLVKKKK